MEPLVGLAPSLQAATIRVYETRPVAAEGTGALKLALSRGFAPRTSAFAERRAELITP